MQANTKSDVYYFINKSNEYIVITAKHVPSTDKENAKLIIDDERVIKEYYKEYYTSGNNYELVFTCGTNANYKDKHIFYYNNRVDLPILNNGTETVLTIKSTNDYFNTNENSDTANSLCSIANSMLKIARPIQYPLNGFDKMNEIENKDLVSILFSNIYYGHNDTTVPTLEENLREFKELIDYHILPSCSDFLETNFTLSECNVATLTQSVEYNNCKKTSEDTLSSTVCNYIPLGNIISVLTYVVTGIFYFTGLICLVLMIK
ncbi:hypothetical protein PIROE2DRAFT_9113 [Piromyces sp. E2]|nr:hypothetical protein PIROE2DRAFT_9113 [Piromyces sp. E2]|eukprot:OUM64151.1 hypothetical protein PIROE2DRAFT_9113 [Piromyces sp. E2]